MWFPTGARLTAHTLCLLYCKQMQREVTSTNCVLVKRDQSCTHIIPHDELAASSKRLWHRDGFQLNNVHPWFSARHDCLLSAPFLFHTITGEETGIER